MTIRAVVLTATVLACTGLGGWRAASIAAPKPDPFTLVVGEVSYTVDHAERVLGLSDADLGGMSHGIQSLVTDDKTMIKVALVVSAADSPISYDASVLRAFATGSPVAIAPIGGTMSPGRLGAHGRIEGSISFVVPRNGAQITLRAPGDPRVVALLRVDVAPAVAGAHHHSSTAPSKPAAPARPARPAAPAKPAAPKSVAK